MNQGYYKRIKLAEGLLDGTIEYEALPVIPQSAVANNAGNKFVVVDGVMYSINEQWSKSVKKIIANAKVPSIEHDTEESIVAPSLVCEQ